MSVGGLAALKAKVDTAMHKDMPLSEWRSILSAECGVFVYNEVYIAKRFDHIQYSFVSKETAKEILVDNLYALLRFKYFTAHTDETDKRVKEIVSSFTDNLKTSLLRVAFNWELQPNHHIIKQIPNSCVAFRNGVFDFLNNKWLFKYEVTLVAANANIMYSYDSTYVIMWYVDIDFVPLDIDIKDIQFEDFVELMKELTKDKKNRNYAFELLYNMSHDTAHNFSMQKMKHLSEILGYTVLQQFTQHFVLIMGSGQNGKNSLFDGCLTPFLVPRPASNDLDSIENDRFITGSLENKYHNIFLETSPKTYTQSTMLKALTGSMYQTVESKGINKYSAVLNCKYIFAGNDQDKIKFSDTTVGFRRRINVYEVWYRWDKSKQYLKQGDYYDVTFSSDLREFKADISNTIIYIYFAMYGLLSATNSFKSDFAFTYNEWKQTLADVDTALKNQISALTLSDLAAYIKRNEETMNECKVLFYSETGHRLYRSPQYYAVYKNSSYEKMVNNLADENFIRIVDEQTFFINVSILKKILVNLQTPIAFTQTLKKLFNISELKSFYNNQSYLECTLNGDKLMPITYK